MESKNTITVLIVDDHPVFRRGLKMVLGGHPEIEVVGEAADGIEAMEKAAELQPSVVIMDVQMPRSNGVEATAALRKTAPNSKVIILTVSERNGDVFEAMQAGARGYLLKHVDVEQLVTAIKVVALGDVIISQAIASKLIDYLRPTSEPIETNGAPALSIRELEVLRLVAGGASNSEIADQLSIAEATVKAHLRNIMDKMQVKNRAQAVARAISNGVINHQPSPNQNP
jgi:DNA-binding NarL/FixJ family response regulator